MKIFFLILLSLLTISHLIFTLRPLIYKKNFKASIWDKLARNLAHILLPVVAVLGIFTIETLFKAALLWTPIVFIIISQFFRTWLKENYKVLPITNSIILTVVLILCL